MNSVNMAFWLVFAISAVVSIMIALSELFWLGLIFCLFVILAGIAKLEQDVINRELGEAFDSIENEIKKNSQNLEKAFRYSEDSKTKAEERLQRLDAKRVESERKTENMHRDLVRKIIEVENTLNRMKRDKK